MPDEIVDQEAIRATLERANDPSNASEEETSLPPATDPRQDDPDAEVEPDATPPQSA